MRRVRQANQFQLVARPTCKELSILTTTCQQVDLTGILPFALSYESMVSIQHIVLCTQISYVERDNRQVGLGVHTTVISGRVVRSSDVSEEVTASIISAEEYAISQLLTRFAYSVMLHMQAVRSFETSLGFCLEYTASHP